MFRMCMCRGGRSGSSEGDLDQPTAPHPRSIISLSFPLLHTRPLCHHVQITFVAKSCAALLSKALTCVARLDTCGVIFEGGQVECAVQRLSLLKIYQCLWFVANNMLHPAPKSSKTRVRQAPPLLRSRPLHRSKFALPSLPTALPPAAIPQSCKALVFTLASSRSSAASLSN